MNNVKSIRENHNLDLYAYASRLSKFRLALTRGAAPTIDDEKEASCQSPHQLPASAS